MPRRRDDRLRFLVLDPDDERIAAQLDAIARRAGHHLTITESESSRQFANHRQCLAGNGGKMDVPSPAVGSGRTHDSKKDCRSDDEILHVRWMRDGGHTMMRMTLRPVRSLTTRTLKSRTTRPLKTHDLPIIEVDDCQLYPPRRRACDSVSPNEARPSFDVLGSGNGPGIARVNAPSGHRSDSTDVVNQGTRKGSVYETCNAQNDPPFRTWAVDSKEDGVPWS